MEQTIKILIYLHAFFGGVGLISGLATIFARKGGISHKKTGRIFSWSMIISSLISLIVAKMPHHENLFLFLIGIFTIYLVLAGNRALSLKEQSKQKADRIDISISGGMLLASLIMLAIGITALFQQLQMGALYVFFGGFGLFLTLKDFHTFRNFTRNKSLWLKSHLGRMVGALIASITAFFVAGLNIETTFVWFLPTVAGTAYIIYWSRRLKKSPVMPAR